MAEGLRKKGPGKPIGITLSVLAHESPPALSGPAPDPQRTALAICSPLSTVSILKSGAVQACLFGPLVRKGAPCLPPERDSTHQGPRLGFQTPFTHYTWPLFSSQPAQPYSSPPQTGPLAKLENPRSCETYRRGACCDTGLEKEPAAGARSALREPASPFPGKGSPLPDLGPHSALAGSRATEATTPPARESARNRSSGLGLRAGEGPSHNCCHLLPPPLPAWGRGRSARRGRS